MYLTYVHVYFADRLTWKPFVEIPDVHSDLIKISENMKVYWIFEWCETVESPGCISVCFVFPFGFYDFSPLVRSSDRHSLLSSSMCIHNYCKCMINWDGNVAFFFFWSNIKIVQFGQQTLLQITWPNHPVSHNIIPTVHYTDNCTLGRRSSVPGKSTRPKGTPLNGLIASTSNRSGCKMNNNWRPDQ